MANTGCKWRKGELSEEGSLRLAVLCLVLGCSLQWIQYARKWAYYKAYYGLFFVYYGELGREICDTFANLRPYYRIFGAYYRISGPYYLSFFLTNVVPGACCRHAVLLRHRPCQRSSAKSNTASPTTLTVSTPSPTFTNTAVLPTTSTAATSGVISHNSQAKDPPSHHATKSTHRQRR